MSRRGSEERDRARLGLELAPGLRLVRLLAVGDLGAVYAAEGHADGPVAVKVFHPELAHDLSEGRLRLLRQASEVGHRRVLAPLDVLATPEGRAVVTRLVSGESAAQLTERRRGRIPPSEALRIACDTLELVGTAHAHGVCHGALSLSHVLLDDQGASHLLGFGEARLRDQLGLVPDRRFTAPKHDPRAPSVDGDLWGLAAILFVLLTGVPPCSGGEPRSLASVSDHAPQDLVELVERAFAGRFTDAGAMLAALRHLAENRAIQYAHPLGSALAAESGSHAWLDPARVTQPPAADPSWSSTPPVSPHLTPPSRPASVAPETPRSKLVPSGSPVAKQAPPSSAPRSRRPRAVLPQASDPLTRFSPEARERLSGERNALVALLSFDSALSLEDAWLAARQGPRPTSSAFDTTLAAIEQRLGHAGDALNDLALELSQLRAPDPDRLAQLTAASLEGPTLGPALDAFGPALREHIQASLEHDTHTALRLVTMLHDAVRAPPALLQAERRRVLDALSVPGLVRVSFSRLGSLHDAHTLEALAALLPSLGPSFAAELAGALPLIGDMTLQAKVLHHLESELSGHEQALGELARTTDAHLGIEIARILARIDTLAARHALTTAAESAHAVVRIEALGLGEGPSGEKLRLELKHRLEDAPATERIQILRALADYEVRVAVPFLALRLKSTHLDSLPFEERRSLFHALCVLSPSRAEALAIEVLEHKKLISTGAHEETRALAASTLGEIGSSDDALAVLAHHAERHLGTSERVRHAAAQALEAVHARKLSGQHAHPPRPTRPPPAPHAPHTPHRPSAIPPGGRRK